MNKWIWQSKTYPNFIYDEESLQSLLEDIRQNSKKLNLMIADNQLSTFGCLIKKEDSDTFLLNQDFFKIHIQ